MWLFSGVFTPLYLWVVEKNEIWGRIVGFWETLVDIFHHSLTFYRSITNWLIKKYDRLIDYGNKLVAALKLSVFEVIVLKLLCL